LRGWATLLAARHIKTFANDGKRVVATQA